MLKDSEDRMRKLSCDKCLKTSGGKTRRKYYVQLKRLQDHKLYVMLTCITCKHIDVYRAKEIPQKDKRFMKLGTGPVWHCFNKVHRVYISKKNVIAGCLKCGKKQYFRREDNGKR